MRREDISELHFITPIGNVSSILMHGILSHARAEHLSHYSIAMQKVQERRADKDVPGGRLLHEYANLYFDAHNPMLSKRRDRNNDICVLQVSSSVLDLPGVIITDQNAASDYARFYSVERGLAALNEERVFAQYWTHHNNPIERMQHGSEKCAEVLIPDLVEAKYILGAYVSNQTALKSVQELSTRLTATVKGDMFF